MATIEARSDVIDSRRIPDDRRRVGLLYHPKVVEARALASDLEEALRGLGAEPTVLSAWDREGIGSLAGELDWIVSLGGDGSLVAIARETAEHGLPILGVNFGRLGFLSELQPAEALSRVPEGLAGHGWLDSRPMLRCTTNFAGRDLGPYDAVNEVFVGRGHTARLVRLAVKVDGVDLMELGADGLIVATPTGSTAYSLSAGGPVVAPDLDVMLLTPVTPHPACVRPIVLSLQSVIEIELSTNHDATFSVDGHVHHRMKDGDSVRVEVGPHRVRLLRFRAPEEFYATLMQRLRLS